MNTTVILKQLKPSTPCILGWMFIGLLFLSLVYETPSGVQVLTMALLGIGLLAYSVAYEICKSGSHFKLFRLFGFTVLKLKHSVFHPKEIRVFPMLLGKEFEWGPIAALGRKQSNRAYVVRLIQGRAYWTVYRCSSFADASDVGKRLRVVLGVDLELTE